MRSGATCLPVFSTAHGSRSPSRYVWCALSLVVGSLIGGLAALVGGRVDAVVMRFVDIILAFPGFLLAIALAAILGPGLTDLVIALTAMGWTGYARLVRGEVLSMREREYVQAANTLGATPSRILMRHLLPGIAGPLAVQATFGIGGIIVAEASLSFLGLGAMPPTPSWGNMLETGRAFLHRRAASHDRTRPRDRAIGARIQSARRWPRATCRPPLLNASDWTPVHRAR